jgi:hypothetical protein
MKDASTSFATCRKGLLAVAVAATGSLALIGPGSSVRRPGSPCLKRTRFGVAGGRTFFGAVSP